jgi:hydrogenase maturation protease
VSPRTVVIGLGSPLMGDDGAGLAALDRLRTGWNLEDVDLVDGGTWGMSLLPVIEDAGRLVLLDAIKAGAAAGEIVVLERDRLPVYLSRKLSPHEVDLRDVLALAELRGTLPSETVAIGVQPEVVELGTELSPPVAAAIELLAETVVSRLERWRHRCSRIVREVACTR